ncbi:MAG: cysteine protease [Prevotella sp.]|nr:cysteine protease [Prevotella sp.]
MKKLSLYLIILCLFSACKKTQVEVEKAPARFKTDVLLKTTPVKSQGHSSLCWAYAMLATIETEHLMQGDSVNLSADFVARAFLKEQLMERMYRSVGRQGSQVSDRQVGGLSAQKGSLSAQMGRLETQTSRLGSLNGPFTDALTTRGVGSMLIRLIQTYGLTHYDAYRRQKKCNYNVLCRKLMQQMEAPVGRLKSLQNDGFSAFQERVDKTLDDEIGPAPRFVFMLGAEYTALEFAHSVCRDDEYESLTSFTHHPFGQRFPLELTDNRYHDTFLNVPLDTLMHVVKRSLRRGHPVCWEGDVSEPGFSFRRGVAMLMMKHPPMTRERSSVTQKMRQESFETGLTTDDHCMEIVGLAHDESGRNYFIMKNSWGTNNPYGGFMYVSEDYVRLKTIAVFLPKAALV